LVAKPRRKNVEAASGIAVAVVESDDNAYYRIAPRPGGPQPGQADFDRAICVAMGRRANSVVACFATAPGLGNKLTPVTGTFNRIQIGIRFSET
jgi:hypothetical protein